MLKLGEHMRLNAILKGAREPYRYEREVEEFLRWSPHVKRDGDRRESRLSPRDVHELRSLLEAYAETAGIPRRTDAPATRPAEERPAAPEPEPIELEGDAESEAAGSPRVAQYGELEVEEVISLLGSLEDEDLEALLGYERSGDARPVLIAALEGVLERRRARSGQGVT